MRKALICVLATLFLPATGFADSADRFTEIFTTCMGGTKNALKCEKDLWAFADVATDGKLTVAELSRLARVGGEALDRKIRADGLESFGSMGGDQMKMLGNEEAPNMWFLAFFLGPMTADILISNFDYDADGTISRKELYADLPEGKFSALVAEVAESGKQTLGKASSSLFDLWAQNALGLRGGKRAPKSLSKLPKTMPKKPKSPEKQLAKAASVARVVLSGWSAAFHAQKPTAYYAIEYTLQNNFKRDVRQIEGTITFRETGGEPFMSIQVAKGDMVARGKSIQLSGNYPINASVPEQMKLRNLDKQNIRAELMVERVVFADKSVRHYSASR